MGFWNLRFTSPLRQIYYKGLRSLSQKKLTVKMNTAMSSEALENFPTFYVMNSLKDESYITSLKLK
jgi:hypothetical protein